MWIINYQKRGGGICKDGSDKLDGCLAVGKPTFIYSLRGMQGRCKVALHTLGSVHGDGCSPEAPASAQGSP